MEKNHPKVTLEQIEARVVGEEFIVRDTLTLCILTLVNGAQIIGQSACVSPENFDAERGRQIARDNAVDQVWPLEGYALRNRLLFQRDAETAARIETLAAEVDGVSVACSIACLVGDDVEAAKRLIRQAMEVPGTGDYLRTALALLTPEFPPLAFGDGPAIDGNPFDDFLDRSIDEITPDLDGLSLIELGVILQKECGGKTRKGLVRAIGAEIAGRSSGEE